jgi:hypothetical protein
VGGVNLLRCATVIALAALAGLAFYTKPWTLNMVVDEPAPPLLTSCKTTYLAIGPS